MLQPARCGCFAKSCTRTQGIVRVQADTGTPVVYGVLNCLTTEQAQARAGLTGTEKYTLPHQNFAKTHRLSGPSSPKPKLSPI